MQQFIADRIDELADANRLEQIVNIIKEEKEGSINMKSFFDDAVSRYGDVLQKLAQ
jgi:hypothetical protein